MTTLESIGLKVGPVVITATGGWKPTCTFYYYKTGTRRRIEIHQFADSPLVLPGSAASFNISQLGIALADLPPTAAGDIFSPIAVIGTLAVGPPVDALLKIDAGLGTSSLRLYTRVALANGIVTTGYGWPDPTWNGAQARFGSPSNFGTTKDSVVHIEWNC